MSKILSEVDEAILEVLRDKLASVPKASIVIQPNGEPPKKTPLVRLWNRAFTASDISVGANAPETILVVEDKLDGNSKTTDFKLSSPPLRPILSLETPLGYPKKEGVDFTADYRAGSIRFAEAPKKGRGNVLIRYRSTKESGEVKGLHVELHYELSIWASDAKEQGKIAREIAEVMLINREALDSKGIRLRLTGGRDLTGNDGVQNGVLCKRLDCIVDTEMMIRIPLTRIEKIELKQGMNR